MNASTVVTIEDIEMSARHLDPQKAAAIFKTHGALVVRGLSAAYAELVRQDAQQVAQQSIALLDKAVKTSAGWSTPNGTLFLPAPPGFDRDKQIMVLGMNYRNSAAFFASAMDTKTVDIVEAILGPNIELFMEGQSLYKEPVGGHPKKLHQDASYFEHKHEGPVAVLNYCVDTDLNNGALHVVPGSHKLGVLRHVDTFSHLGLDENEWPWEKALPVCGKPGDAIFFHVNTIHGSKENHSDKARPVFINRYRRADDYIVISAHNTQARDEAAKHVEEARKENQLGLMVRGSRGFDAGRLG